MKQNQKPKSCDIATAERQESGFHCSEVAAV